MGRIWEGTRPLAVAVVLALAVGPLLQWEPSWNDAATGPLVGDPVQGPAPQNHMAAAKEMFSGLGDAFIENRGQLDDPAVLFYTPGRSVSVGLTCGGIVVVIRGVGPETDGPAPMGVRPAAGATAHFVMAFDGCNEVRPVGRGPLDRVSNYFHGNNTAAWVRGALSFHEVVYTSLYDGVDLVLRLKGGVLKYDLLLDAGADAGRIVFRYENARGLALDETTCDLVIRTAAGEIRDGRPMVFQAGVLPEGGACGRFRIIGDDRVGFELPSGCSRDRPVLIDPGLVFLTYLGGEGDELLSCVDIDAGGDIVVSGQTSSADFPMTNGSYDPVGNVTALMDLVVSRLNESGHVRSSTFFGGHRDESSRDVEIAPDGSIIVAAESNSTDVYVTGDALQSTSHGAWDGVLLWMSSDLSRVLYSTYFGGSSDDTIVGIDLDAAGRACISGLTNSSDLPTTPGAYCATYVRTGAAQDSIFVCRLSSSLAQLSYCTYLNGFDTSWHPNIDVHVPNSAVSQAIDGSGRLYVAGKTHSPTFPTSAGAYQRRLWGGDTDGFVALLKFDGSGPSDLVASTFFGGEGRDEVMGVVVLGNGNVCVNVGTNSSLLEVSEDAAYKTQRQGDNFLAILSWNLTHMVYGSYFGGNGLEVADGLAGRPGDDMVYLMGETASSNLDLTPGCFDDELRGGFIWTTRFIAAFNASSRQFGYCTLLIHGTYYCLNNHFCEVDRDGSLVLAGVSNLVDLPVTRGAYQELFMGGGIDGYVLRLDPRPCGLPDPPASLAATPGDARAELTWDPHTNVGYRVLGYVIYRGTSPGTLAPLDSVDGGAMAWGPDTGLTNGETYYYGVAAVNTKGEGPPAIVNATPLALPSAPRALKLDTGDGTVTITWTPPASTGGRISGFHVLRGLTSDGLERVSTTEADASSYRDTEVVKGVRYYYGVCAFNDAGNGTMARGYIVPRSPPSAPRNLTLVPGDGKVNVTWQPPADDGGGVISVYNVHIRDAQTNVTRVIPVPKPALVYEDKSARNGQLYYYFVTARALDLALSREYEGEPTPTLAARPFGPPSAPNGLTSTPGDGMVSLGWSPPSSDNGAPITGYVILWGSSPSALDNRVEVGNQTGAVVPLPKNGVVYYFQVAAVNVAGLSDERAYSSTTPFGEPGMVEGLTADLQDGAVLLKWSPPTEKGGAQSLRYTVLKRMPDDSFASIGELVDVCELLDDTTEVGSTYKYRVVAANALFSSEPAEVSVHVMRTPSAVTDLTVATGDGLIDLRWAAPESDGGSGITAYFIWKRSSDGKYAQLNWTLLLTYADSDVTPGGSYWYYVIAKNVMGNSPIGREKNATVLTHPGPIVELQVVYREGATELSWIAPSKQWGAPPTGYLVMRGTSPSDLLVIADLGLNQTYKDETVEKGIRYYYRVVAKSELGQGDPMEVQDFIIPAPTQVPITTWAALALVIVVVVIAVVLVAYMKRRADAAAGVPTVHIVEEVLVVLADGRLIASAWREESRSQDADLMSGMLVAIQGFAREGLERGGMLRSIRYEDNTIVMASGQQVYVAAVVYGNPDQSLTEVLELTVQQIEATYAPTLEVWDGDLSAFAGIDDVLRSIVERTRDVTREDVQRAGAAPRTVDLDE